MRKCVYLNYFKPLMDCILSVIGILLLSPLLLIIALVIKATSKGPILYKQVRYGRNFKPFKLLKFRSMVHNADQKGLLITAKGDPRITSVGAFLRRTKCDELPQLMNVISGDMSLIGPRP